MNVWSACPAPRCSARVATQISILPSLPGSSRAIDEDVDVVQDAVVVDALGVEHDVAAAERAEPARLERAELRIAQRLDADLLRACGRLRDRPERQPDQQRRDQPRRAAPIGRNRPAGPTPQDWIAAISLS